MNIKLFTVLDRYLARQFVGPFLLGIIAIAIISIADILMYLVELVVSRGIPILTVTRLLIYKLPAIMLLYFPMAVLFAVMLVLVRMAKDNELTVLRTSGVPTVRIIFPILIFCVITSGLAYFTSEKVVPWTNQVSDELIRQEISRKPPPDVVQNVVFKVPGNRYFYINKLDGDQSHMQGVLIFEDTRHYPRITTAKEGVWDNNQWTLMDGSITQMGPDGTITFFDEFSQLVIHVNQSLRSFYSKHKSAKEMDSQELKDKISTLEKGGISTRSLKIEYHLKKSLPVASFIFGLVGIAFCLSFVRSGKDWWGVIIAICSAVLTVGLYLVLVSMFRAFAKEGNLTPLLGAWLPNMIYGGLGSIVLLYQSIKK